MISGSFELGGEGAIVALGLRLEGVGEGDEIERLCWDGGRMLEEKWLGAVIVSVGSVLSVIAAVRGRRRTSWSFILVHYLDCSNLLVERIRRFEKFLRRLRRYFQSEVGRG